MSSRRSQVNRLENALPIAQLEFRDARHQVGQRRRLGDAPHGAEQLLRDLRQILQHFERALAELDHARFDLAVAHLGSSMRPTRATEKDSRAGTRRRGSAAAPGRQ
jgi:hypothetical protein